MIASPVAIVVDADLAELRKTEQASSTSGLSLWAPVFAQAKSLLVSITPEIALPTSSSRPSTGSISRRCARCGGRRRRSSPPHNIYDTVLEADAKRLNASHPRQDPESRGT
jgi:hypothetical protein